MPVILATHKAEIRKIVHYKPVWANSSQDLFSKKNPSQKRAGGVAQGVGPEFKPQYCRKKQTRR
jgi:hypothetical protein